MGRSVGIGFAAAVGLGCASPATPAGTTELDSTRGSSGGTSSGGSTGAVDVTSLAGDTTTGDPTTGGADTGIVVDAYQGTLVDRSLVCKLISAAGIDDPTANATHTRFNLRGTDLGVPLAIDGHLLLLFGDSVGYRGIWDFGEDPDAVARVAYADVAADPAVLCSQLEFLVTPDIPSVAAGIDPSIERDFAGAWMLPPPGQTIDAFIADAAGPFANMPGTFEVPSGAMAAGDAAWLFYAGRMESEPRVRATLSYLARWDDPGGPTPTYQIVRAVDDLHGGPLGGHFVQISPVVHGPEVELFGTGDYRHDGVYLARLGLDGLALGDATELYDPQLDAWQLASAMTPEARAALPPMFETDGVGELSIVRLETPAVYLAAYQRELHDDTGAIVDNRVLVRVASAATGPWSEAVTVADMADPAFQAAHCCGTTCEGEQILHCLIAGLYGAYMLPTIVATDLGAGAWQLDIPLLVSTWSPYNVVLLSIALRIDPA